MEHTRSIKIRQTKATIKTSSPRYIDIGISSLLRNRRQLESFLLENKGFSEALIPIDVKEECPEIVARMSAASKKFGVGPMASVAGALADLCLEDMLSKGAQFGMVENGGEIAMSGMKKLLVSIFAGDSPLSSRLGLQIASRDLPIGIGTSSATVGHAMSFGQADAAVAICENACLADAAATRIGNEVSAMDPEQSIGEALEVASRLPDLRGAIVVRRAWVGTWGKLPQLVKISRSFGKEVTITLPGKKGTTEPLVTELKSPD